MKTRKILALLATSAAAAIAVGAMLTGMERRKNA